MAVLRRAGARWAAIAVGFVGVLVILRPGVQVLEPLALLPLASAITFASYQLLTRTVSGMTGRAPASSTQASAGRS